MNKSWLSVFNSGFAKTSVKIRAGLRRGQRVGLMIRELIGWGLLAVGLNVFRISFSYLDQRQVVEAAVAAMIGLFIFRGGMQLLRVSVAARALIVHSHDPPRHDRILPQDTGRSRPLGGTSAPRIA